MDHQDNPPETGVAPPSETPSTETPSDSTKPTTEKLIGDSTGEDSIKKSESDLSVSPNNNDSSPPAPQESNQEIKASSEADSKPLDTISSDAAAENNSDDKKDESDKVNEIDSGTSIPEAKEKPVQSIEQDDLKSALNKSTDQNRVSPISGSDQKNNVSKEISKKEETENAENPTKDKVPKDETTNSVYIPEVPATTSEDSNSKKRTSSGKSKNEPNEDERSSFSEISSVSITSSQLPILLKIINSVLQNKNADPFFEPVDPIALGIPDYPDIVKSPMDLSTVKSKLEGGKYSVISDFMNDVELIFENCFLYNGIDSPISSMAKQLKKFYLSLLNKNLKALTSSTPQRSVASVDDMSPNQQLKKCSSIIKELFDKKHYDIALYFYEPVDYVALDIPTYPKIIKNPMDLGTIKTKLENNEYSEVSEFYKDVKLVFHNCYKFNHKKNPVHIAGKELEQVFDLKWSEAFGDSFVSDAERTLKRLKQSPTQPQSSLNSEDVDTPAKNKKDSISKPNTARRQSKKINTKKTEAEPEEEVEDLTFYEKQQLSTIIQTLPPDRLLIAFNIIQSGYPVPIEQKEEIELDIDVLDFKTLQRLYDYVVLDKDVE
ncbi:hypothetical protein BB560_006580 [Smittium megazygosporum]|uniref:Bromo domain-containing protein n=1 Tax=Smittium megazygosporum TaxID=133381 RepID=A0A2T9Y3R7_9FUNG|nr:hypothetical protein BB560_006580 [Smittium megazygosporum]